MTILPFRKKSQLEIAKELERSGRAVVIDEQFLSIAESLAIERAELEPLGFGALWKRYVEVRFELDEAETALKERS